MTTLCWLNDHVFCGRCGKFGVGGNAARTAACHTPVLYVTTDQICDQTLTWLPRLVKSSKNLHPNECRVVLLRSLQCFNPRWSRTCNFVLQCVLLGIVGHGTLYMGQFPCY